ncbi:MAG: L-serine ammonia-lyase, iron-sulfur-dependent, subunit alpha [Subdoligranulum sp.]|nr:L-serine ammonia-lyase, iron-sulfur-dependent, subunit alpha [Subdoligranulum sp.]
MEINYHSLAALIEAAQAGGQPISALVLRQQAAQLEQSEEDLYETMRQSYLVMADSVQAGKAPGVRSASGLSGGDAFRMEQARQTANDLCGGVFTDAITRALAVSEWNAAMGRIVAAPTAGSCGILPAAVLSVQAARNLSERDCVLSLFTASAVGMVIANNASISGAQGGCQAECGSAAAMAAAALVELCGGTPQQVGHAVSIALGNVLGLVCDPVAGLVEIPCIHRNASGVAGALVAAQLALAGIQSPIPADEAILAMKRVGDAMPQSLRETAEGGLAATPTGRRLHQQVFGAPAQDGAHISSSSCPLCRPVGSGG